MVHISIDNTIFICKNNEQMDKIEVLHLKKKIQLYETVLDCLNVKLFYLQHKNFTSESADNDNRLEKIKTYNQIQIQTAKLSFLNSEFQIKYDILKDQNNAE